MLFLPRYIRVEGGTGRLKTRARARLKPGESLTPNITSTETLSINRSISHH